jgi:hypothetical protein
LAAVNSIEKNYRKMTQVHFSAYDQLDSIDRRNIDLNNVILQQSTAVDEYTAFNPQDDSINQSLSDFLNEQMMPDVDMADECSVQLPIPYDQGSNIA